MLLSLSILGIILSAVMLYFNTRKYSSSVFLGALFFFISLYGLAQYILFYSRSVTFVALIYSNGGYAGYLVGPLLYIYIRSVVKDSIRLKKRDLLHLLPMLIYLAGTFNYMISPWAFKTEIAKQIVDSSLSLHDFTKEMGWIFTYVTPAFVYLSRPVMVLFYLFCSDAMLIRYIRFGKKSNVLRKQHFMIHWLWVLLGFLHVLVIGHTLQLTITFIADDLNIFRTLYLLQVISAVGLAGLLIPTFFFPNILYGMPRLPKSIAYNAHSNLVTSEESMLKKNTHAKFEKRYTDLIGEKIKMCMVQHQPYLQQDLNMTRLSVLINIPVHHLAWYFREVQKQSFTDFRNEYRIRHAQMLIKEGKTAGMTLEAIGMLSGFMSRNAFLTAFKKVEGITPHEYVNRNKD